MALTLSTCFVLVHDPDLALAFYRDKLGLDLRNDVARGSFRWVTVGAAEQPGVSIVLTNYLNGSPADNDTLASLIAKGALNGIHFHTDDLDATFEKLRAELRAGGIRTQQMLTPVPVELNPARASQVQTAIGEIRAMGFDVEPFGPMTLLMKGAPAVFGPEGGAKLLADMIDSMGDAGFRGSGESAFENWLKQLACHGSVRVGRVLEMAEIHSLLAELDRTEFKTNCPHGRPVHIHFGRGQIERMFRR